MIKLVAFDWNGTLLDDAQLNVKCSNILFANFGIKPITLRRFRETFHIPILSFWVANGGRKEDLDIEEDHFFDLYEARVNKTKLRSGVKGILARLEKQRIKRMIFSNHITPAIIRQLIRLDIYEYFDEILARPANDASLIQGRNKEQKLRDYVKRNKLKANEVMVIGDTEEEIDIGKKYGYRTVAITGGYNSVSRLRRLHPDFLINRLSELPKIIKKLNAKR